MTMATCAPTRRIRPTTIADLPRLCDLFEAFRSSSVYAQYGPAHPEVSTALLERLLTHPDAIIFGAEDERTLVGMIGVMVTPHPMTGERMATELFWWMDPAHRGQGLALLSRAERWASDQGAVRLLMVSPHGSPDVERMYTRLNYVPVETSWQKSLSWFARAAPRRLGREPHGIVVHDDVLTDPVTYRQQALTQRFRPVRDGMVLFQGIAPCADPTLPLWIVQHYPSVQPTWSFFRQSAQDQVEPHFIHTDVSMGDWTAILYLTPNPPDEDGTGFWRHRETGRVRSVEISAAEATRWADVTAWDRWHVVSGQFNRLVLFPSALYHARAIPENYGQGNDARLTQVVFGTGRLR